MCERLLKRSTILRHGYGTLADHVRVGHQLLSAPLRQLVITLEAGNKATVRRQNLYTVVLPVGNVDVPILVYAYATGPVKLAHTAARLSTARQMLAIRRELLDAVVTPVGHVHITVRVQTEAPGHVQLARPTAEDAELTLVFAIQRELLDAVVTAIGHVHAAVGDRQPCRLVQFAISRARLAPFAQEGAIFVEDRNAVQPLVGDVDIPILIQGNGGRPHELAVAFATGAKLSDVLLIERDYRDVYAIGAVFIRPIDDIDHIIRGQGQVHWIPKPRPANLVTAHRVAVAKRPILNAKKVCTHSISFAVIECILPLPRLCRRRASSPFPLGEGRGEGPTMTAGGTLTLTLSCEGRRKKFSAGLRGTAP